MKILSAHNYYQEAGGEDLSHAANINMLRDYGHPVLEYKVHNESIAQMGKVPAACRTLWNRHTYKDLLRVLRRWKPDVAHFTNIFPLISPSAYLACKAYGVAVVQGLHNYRLLCPSAYFLRDGVVCEKCIGKTFAAPSVLHRCYRRTAMGSLVVASMSTLHRLGGTWSKCVDMYLTPSKFSRSKFLDAGFCTEDRLAVKPNFIDPDPGVGLGGGGYAIFVGRLSPEKGIDVLLDAWRQLEFDLPLKIVGTGELMPRVAEESTADSNIEVLGWREHGEVLELIGQASCLVMPSLWYETFGRTMIEAFAKGCPVVASRIGCMEELVEDGVNGLLFPKGDCDSLAKCVSKIVRSDCRASLSAAARDTYLRKYTKSKNYPVLLEIYQQAIDNFWCKDGQQDEKRFNVG